MTEREQEVAAIVRWLRGPPAHRGYWRGDGWQRAATWLADAIERGDYLEGEGDACNH